MSTKQIQQCVNFLPHRQCHMPSRDSTGRWPHPEGCRRFGFRPWNCSRCLSYRCSCWRTRYVFTTQTCLEFRSSLKKKKKKNQRLRLIKEWLWLIDLPKTSLDLQNPDYLISWAYLILSLCYQLEHFSTTFLLDKVDALTYGIWMKTKAEPIPWMGCELLYDDWIGAFKHWLEHLNLGWLFFYVNLWAQRYFSPQFKCWFSVFLGSASINALVATLFLTSTVCNSSLSSMLCCSVLLHLAHHLVLLLEMNCC